MGVTTGKRANEHQGRACQGAHSKVICIQWMKKPVTKLTTTLLYLRCSEGPAILGIKTQIFNLALEATRGLAWAPLLQTPPPPPTHCLPFSHTGLKSPRGLQGPPTSGWPQGLCTCCSSCLEQSSLSYSHMTCSLHSFKLCSNVAFSNRPSRVTLILQIPPCYLLSPIPYFIFFSIASAIA